MSKHAFTTQKQENTEKFPAANVARRDTQDKPALEIQAKNQRKDTKEKTRLHVGVLREPIPPHHLPIAQVKRIDNSLDAHPSEHNTASIGYRILPSGTKYTIPTQMKNPYCTDIHGHQPTVKTLSKIWPYPTVVATKPSTHKTSLTRIISSTAQM